MYGSNKLTILLDISVDFNHRQRIQHTLDSVVLQMATGHAAVKRQISSALRNDLVLVLKCVGECQSLTPGPTVGGPAVGYLAVSSGRHCSS